jgi:acetyl-CoA synthetase (ADP-forming)
MNAEPQTTDRTSHQPQSDNPKRLHPQQVGIAELLSPKSVAVLGASEDLEKFGGRIFKVLVQHRYPGTIYPISRKSDSLFGVDTYASLQSLPVSPDMVIMAIPRDAVRKAVEDCVGVGARVAIIVTSRFSDAGEEGAALEREIVEIARAGNLRLIGPNCLGLISPVQDLTLCASPALYVDKLIKGRIGMVSQSGALMTTMFDRAQARGIGFSHCFSIGNQADLEMSDFIEFLIEDPSTDVICSYIEGVKDVDRFLAAAEKARKAGKPWLAVKAGRTAAGAAAAFSHTASLAGSNEAFAAACQEAGVLLMDDTDAMVLLAASVSRFSTTVDDSVTVLTTSGGSAALSADRLSDAGIDLTNLPEDLCRALAEVYEDSSAHNPLDMGVSRSGDWGLVAQTSARLLLSDQRSGFLLAPITTSPDIRLICERIIDGAEEASRDQSQRPYLIVLQPGAVADEARRMMRERGVFFSDSLDEAMRMLTGLRDLRKLTDRLAIEEPRPFGADVSSLTAVSYKGALSEDQAKSILSKYGVMVNRGEIATNEAEAADIAARLHAPFVLKVVSKDIVHKSDVGGVMLNLQSPEEVSEAVLTMRSKIVEVRPEAEIEGFLVQEMRTGKVEILIGTRYDPQFGPLIMAGAGGVLVELMRDVTIARAPVGPKAARRMLEGLKIAPLLAGYRGSVPLDTDVLADTISRVSWLAHDLGDRLLELDINPLLVDIKGAGCVAVDARMLMANS